MTTTCKGCRLAISGQTNELINQQKRTIDLQRRIIDQLLTPYKRLNTPQLQGVLIRLN